MSIRQNTWDLHGHYDLTNSGQNNYIQSDKELYSFGYNSNGQLGLDNLTQYSSPVQVPGISWSSVSGSYTASFGVKSDGTLWAWGNLNNGTSGTLEANPYRSSPVQVPGTQWSKIEAGIAAIFAIKTDNTLWAWGRNYSGQMGQNEASYDVSYSSPIQIPGTQWDLVSNARTQTLGLKTDGTLWAWGNNSNGQLGQGNITFYLSPVQIPGTQWSTISSAYYRSYATKSDGTLWAWGSNNNGQLGQGNTTGYSSPRQIPGTQWSSVPISMSYQGIFAFKNDNTLWAWGYNVYGTLGLNDNVPRSSPIQIPGTQWLSLSSSYNAAIALKTDGTAWSWGRGHLGYLGVNDTIRYSSPVQIPGTQWSGQGVGGYVTGYTFLLKNP